MSNIVNDSSKDNFIDLLFSDARGKIFALNGFHCYKYGILSEFVIKDYINTCHQYFINEEYKDFDILYKNLSQTSYYFNGNPVSIDLNEKQILVSHVMDYRVLVQIYLDKVAISEGHAYLDFNVDPIDDENTQEVLKILNDKSDFNKFKKNKKLGDANNAFWITTTDAIEDIRKKCSDNIAEQVRTALGLIDIENGSYLIELVVHGNKLNSSSHYPTFIEGGNHRRFKVIKWSTYPNEDWGKTAHLEKIKNAAENIDGVPELVVKPLELECLCVTFRPLGFTLNAMDIEFENNENDDELFLDLIIRNNKSIDHQEINEALVFFRGLLN